MKSRQDFLELLCMDRSASEDGDSSFLWNFDIFIFLHEVGTHLQTTWCYNPEGSSMNLCHCESFRSFIKVCLFFFFGQLQGFKAQVTREPTDIVVKIPTPPPPQEQVQQPQYVAVSPLSYDTKFLWKIAQAS